MLMNQPPFSRSHCLMSKRRRRIRIAMKGRMPTKMGRAERTRKQCLLTLIDTRAPIAFVVC
jgi:hypothetical protein